ncbi:MAG TPA: hypothetical protein VGA73_01895 [Candidatus Binatia bacterium]
MGLSVYLKGSAAAGILAILPLLAPTQASAAVSQYTPRQIELFSSYLGKTYWVVDAGQKQTPAFLNAASPDAPVFHPAVKESFQLKEILGRETSRPYYKAAFDSGKEGFIAVQAFLEELNGSFTAIDPERDSKAKAAKAVTDEEKRRDWIRQQKWPEHVKEAALRKEPALGMNKKEATSVMGKPKSVIPLKISSAIMGKQEQWLYENGPVLTFSNGILTRIQPNQ